MTAPADRTGRRRARGAAPRNRQVRLVLSDEELETLRALASERGISVQRMLVDDALGGKVRLEDRASSVGVDEVVGELVGLRQEAQRIGKNLNRLVTIAEPRGGNDVDVAVAEARALMPELRATVGELRAAAAVVGARR